MKHKLQKILMDFKLGKPEKDTVDEIMELHKKRLRNNEV